MEFEEDYSEYDDYIDLDRQWSGTKEYDHGHSQDQGMDQFQGRKFKENILNR